MKNLRIVLIEPDIPQNTGNIMRLAAVTSTSLLLVGKLGFSLSEKHLKRAGMDYINDVDLQIITTIDEYLEDNRSRYFLTTKCTKLYTDIPNDIEACDIVFGSESEGLPQEFYSKYSDQLYTIPMKKGFRSLNLSSSVAIVTYHLLSRNGFIDIL